MLILCTIFSHRTDSNFLVGFKNIVKVIATDCTKIKTSSNLLSLYFKIRCPLTKGYFPLLQFLTCMYARKSLNLFQLYSRTNLTSPIFVKKLEIRLYPKFFSSYTCTLGTQLFATLVDLVLTYMCIKDN